MRSTRDPDLLIKAFLDEGIDELPDRSFDAVRTAIDQTRQWAVIGLWKEPQIMNATRLAIAAVAIVVVAVLAIKFLPTTNVGPAPTPTLTPSASPAPTPTPTPMSLQVNSNGPAAIEAGTYAAASPFLVPLTFTVPADWWGTIGGPNLVALSHSDGHVVISMQLFTKVFADPCHNNLGLLSPLPGDTVDDLVTTLTKMPSVTASAVTDATIGGLPTKQLTLTAPASFTGCTLTSDGFYRIWQLPLGATNDLTPGEVDRIWILEVDGQRLVIDTNGPRDNSVLQGVLDSINFTAQP
ncbi:MAG TPA: hypothetical protein VIK08_05765 [Candidatus Limnocylindrales bacterium]